MGQHGKEEVGRGGSHMRKDLRHWGGERGGVKGKEEENDGLRNGGLLYTSWLEKEETKGQARGANLLKKRKTRNDK